MGFPVSRLCLCKLSRSPTLSGALAFQTATCFRNLRDESHQVVDDFGRWDNSRPRSRPSKRGLREVIQATAPRWITGLARTQTRSCLRRHEVLRCRVLLKIFFADTEAVTQEAVARIVLHSYSRAQLRLENCRPVFTEIHDFARRVAAEEITGGRWQPFPRCHDMLCNGSSRHFRTFAPIHRARSLPRVAPFTCGRAAAVAHFYS